MGVKTLVQMLEGNAREFPGKDALVFGETRLSYKALNEAVNRAANAFLKNGVRKGDIIGLMLPRIPELVVGFLASAKAGAVAAPINYELTRDRVSGLLRTLNPRAVVAHADFTGLLDDVAQTDIKGFTVLVGGPQAGESSWREFIGGAGPENPGISVDEGDIAYLNYTSGSTGESKGALATHANIYWNTYSSVEALGLRREDVHLCMFASFAHPHEIFSRSVFLGGTMVIVDKIYPKSIAEAIEANRVTCMMGLSPMYENLLELMGHKHYDLSSLRVPESGGMYTRTELIERFRDKVGASIVPVWGSTETTGIAIANRPGANVPSGSVGTACPGYGIKIVDEESQELPDGEVGEMVFKGPGVVGGYFEGMDAGRNSFRDGWYYSGDLARRDARGYFYFVERKTGMMKIAGLKVFPTEIELTLLDHVDIREATVVSVKDRLRGEVPKAVIVLKNGKSMTARDVFNFCRQRLAHYKVPRIVEFRDCLPKTPGGKIDKKALQTEAARS